MCLIHLYYVNTYYLCELFLKCYIFHLLIDNDFSRQKFSRSSLSSKLSKLVDMKWIKQYTLLRIKKYFCTSFEGILRIMIKEAEIFRSNYKDLIGNPFDVGSYIELCTICNKTKRYKQKFNRCYICHLPICYRCINEENSVYLCQLCKRIKYIKCKRSESLECQQCNGKNVINIKNNY